MIAPARTLCLVPKCPLPPDTGGRQRIFHLLQALHATGPIDVVVTEPIGDDDRAALVTTFPGARVWAPEQPFPPRRRARKRWLTARELPLGLALLDLRAARREVAAFVEASPDPYDLVWSYTPAASWMFQRVLRRMPLVCDVADVTSVLRARELAVARRSPDARSWRGLKRIVRLTVEQRRVGLFEREEAARATLVTVCSATDREALGLPGVEVLPNAYARPAAPCGRREVGPAPVLLFAGQMTYHPNEDAAAWFVDAVLPLVRTRFPDVRLSIVGRPTPAVRALAAADGVEVRGYVEDITAELATADVVVVPLRQGSGTRIKILEAWAHHLPVVSTSIGAEGLGATNGRELLIADAPAAFAAAIERVLTDDDLRATLVDEGADRFERDYDWEPIGARFAARARTVAAEAHVFPPKVAR